MAKTTRIFAATVSGLLAACSDPATGPTANGPGPDGPSFTTVPVTYASSGPYRLVASNVNWSGSTTTICNSSSINPTSGSWYGGRKWEPAYTGAPSSFSPASGITVSLDPTLKSLSWTVEPASGYLLTAVLLKGSTGQNAYYYNSTSRASGLPAVVSGTGVPASAASANYGAAPLQSAGGLVAPPTSRGQQSQVSNVIVCYQVRPAVSKTVGLTWDRSWTWGLTKVHNSGSSSGSPLTFDRKSDPADQFMVAYTLTPTATATNTYVASGTISVGNPTTVGMTLTGITDVISVLNAGSATPVVVPLAASELSCKDGSNAAVSFVSGYPLVPGATITCDYSKNISGVTGIDVATSTVSNTATASATGTGVGNGSGSAIAGFPAAPGTDTDRYASLVDDKTDLGEAAALDATTLPPNGVTYSRTFDPASLASLTVPIGAGVCGNGNDVNTAKILSTASPSTVLAGPASTTVYIRTIGCGGGEDSGPNGCTPTQGYWGTHSHLGPAKYNVYGWGKLFPGTTAADGGSRNPFVNNSFSTGETWASAFRQDSRDYYWSLAQQYMAARLNIANGAKANSGVDAAMAAAQTMLQDYSGNVGGVTPGMASGLVEVLTAFNQGETLFDGNAVPHCTSAPAAPAAS